MSMLRRRSSCISMSSCSKRVVQNNTGPRELTMTPTGMHYYRLPGHTGTNGHQNLTIGKRQFSTTVVEMEATVVEEVFEPETEGVKGKLKTKMLTDRYLGMKPREVPQRLTDLTMDQLRDLENETKQRFGFQT